MGRGVDIPPMPPSSAVPAVLWYHGCLRQKTVSDGFCLGKLLCKNWLVYYVFETKGLIIAAVSIYWEVIFNSLLVRDGRRSNNLGEHNNV